MTHFEEAFQQLISKIIEFHLTSEATGWNDCVKTDVTACQKECDRYCMLTFRRAQEGR